MIRLARALMYLVLPAELLLVVLLLAGVTPPAPVIIAAEAAVAVVLVVEAATAVHLFRAERRRGATRRQAAAAVAGRILPAPVRRMLWFETRMGASLVRWLLRRRGDVPPGATPLSYAREQGTFLALLVFAMAVEGVVADVLLNVFDVAAVVRVLVLALHVYSVYLGLGVHASCVVRPHVVTDSELRVRYGVFFEARIPRRLISSVRPARNYDERGVVTVAGGGLAVAVSARTNLVVELSEPITVVRPFGARAEVASVRFFADAPAAALAALTPEKGASDMIK